MAPRKQPWFSISPRATLLVTLGASMAVLVGGICLARHVEQVRTPGDRKPVLRAGEEMEEEVGQLERLYEKHLRQLVAVTVPMGDPPGISDACGSIVGVEQWSLIHASNGSLSDVHVPVGPAPRDPLPKPTFQVKADGMEPNDLLLSTQELFQVDGPAWGWIADPGKPLLFWERTDPHSGRAVVMAIDPQAVHDALDGWLASWARHSFAPLHVRNGPFCSLESSGRMLLSTGAAPTTEPDFILPVRSLFGTWEITAWDRVVERVNFDSRTLVLAAFLAFVIFVLGVIAFLQQKRLLAQTAQRVTFLNRVSHELRSPLTNILLNIDLSLEMLADQAGRPVHRLALVQEEAHRLRRLVDNVLTFSSIEQKKQRFETHPCVPDDVIRGVIHQFDTAFARREITVKYRGNAAHLSRLDSDALTQILANLFSNVEKYAPQGTVTIEAELRSDLLVITVSDMGPGIPASEAERVFQPFERVNGHISEGASGTGLGLSIARDLALGMGGVLRLVPCRGGASFELQVPALPVHASRRAAA